MADEYLSEERRDYLQKQFEQDQHSVFGPIAMGLGAIGIGATILGTKLSRGNVVANLLHLLGRPGQLGTVVDQSLAQAAAGQVKTGQRSIFSLLDRALDVRSGQLKIHQLDLISDVVHASELQGFGGEALHKKFTESIHRRYANRPAGFFGNHLQRITVGEVLQNQDGVWENILGRDKLSHLAAGVRSKLVRPSHVLDQNLYKTAQGELRDLRNPFRVWAQARQARLGDGVQASPFLDLFGQRDVFSALLGARTRFAALAPAREGHVMYPRVFVDGTVYKLGRTYASDEVQLLEEATGRKLRRLVGLGGGGAPGLRTIHEAREGTLQFGAPLKRGETAPTPGLSDRLGVGRQFRTRPSALERWALHPLQRLRALHHGRAVVYRGKYRRVGPQRLMDAVTGDEMPELAAGANVAYRKIAGGGRTVDFAQLPLKSKFSVLFGLSDEMSVLSKGRFEQAFQEGTPLGGEDLLIRRPSGNLRSSLHDNRLPDYIADAISDKSPPQLTAAGEFRSRQTASYYDVKRGFGAGLREFLNYTQFRVNNLASESMLGIGFKPSGSILTNMARMAAIPFVYEAGRQYAMYADHLLDRYLGVSPIQGLASLYAGAREAQQELREGTGIQQGMSWLEQNFPGSVNSGLGFLARSVVAPALVFGSIASTGNLMGGLFGALGTYAAIGGPKPDQPAQELREEYAGQRKVPVREGRGWGLGYTPWEGGRVIRYEHSWYHKLTSGYRMKSLYGSEDEYYGHHFSAFGIPLPGLHNAFGLANLSDPYRLERLHYRDRPYPVSGSFGEEFPVFGPLISGTIGNILKPPRYRTDFPLLKAGIVDRGLTQSAAQDLGLPSLAASQAEIRDPNDPLARLARLANVASEPAGVYKFALTFLGVDLPPSAELADSTAMDSTGRAYYDLAMGGIFGGTEFIRRFILSDRYRAHIERQKANYIPNQMPDWMPGSLSAIDPQYFVDFTVGDPYAKIESGEARLPGAGYEALNDLHSGVPGMYSAVDRFLILADTAPFSKATRQYAAMVDKLNLDPETRKKVEVAKQQLQEVQAPSSRYPRYGERPEDVQMGHVMAGLRQGWDVLTHDVLEEIPLLGAKLAPFRSDLEEFERQVVEGKVYANWDDPIAAIAMPAYRDIENSSLPTALAKGAGLGMLLSSRFGLSFLNPVRGSHSLGWFNPATTAVGAGLAGAANLAGAPASDDDAFAYVDRAMYLRARVMEEEAAAMGQPGLAAQFRQQSSRTMLGARNPYNMVSALPNPSERRFFRRFENAPEPLRPQILEAAPPHFAHALESTWSGDFPGREQADRVALEFARHAGLPGIGSGFWNPSFPSQGMKIQLSEDQANYLHRQVFYDSQRTEMAQRFPDLHGQELQYELPDNFESMRALARYRMRQARDHYQRVDVQAIGATPYRQGHRYYITHDRREEMLQTALEVLR